MTAGGFDMHKRIARFEKVSFEQFYNAWADCFPDTNRKTIEDIYDRIRLPKRATSGSAGYDFYSPSGFLLFPGDTVKIPTGIRARMEEGWVLQLFPRSSMGFKFRMQLDNTVGIVDSDYYYSDNEGHIFAKITNDSNQERTLELTEGTAFLQGVFLAYGITEDDDVSEIRNGGMGSTDK